MANSRGEIVSVAVLGSGPWSAALAARLQSDRSLRLHLVGPRPGEDLHDLFDAATPGRFFLHNLHIVEVKAKGEKLQLVSRRGAVIEADLVVANDAQGRPAVLSAASDPRALARVRSAEADEGRPVDSTVAVIARDLAHRVEERRLEAVAV
jgi:hypothetical protein